MVRSGGHAEIGLRLVYDLMMLLISFIKAYQKNISEVKDINLFIKKCCKGHPGDSWEPG